MRCDTIAKIASVMLFLTNVAVANEFVSQSTAILATRLQNFCNEDKNTKLHIADLLMEQIAKAGLTERKTLRKDIDPHLFQAGGELLALAKKIYANKDTVDSCQEDIAAISYHLELSNFALDRKSEENLLTKTE